MTRKQKKTLIRICAAAVIFAAALLVPHRIVSLCLFVAAYLIVGYDVLISAVKKIGSGRFLDEKFLMTVATLGAFAISEFPEAVAVMLFYQVGEFFQSVAVGKSRRSIAALMDIRPDEAVVLRGGAEQTVSPEEVEVGEIILVRPGERIALDGVIVEGATTVNTSALTGESVPLDKAVGDRVISGSVNISGLIKVSTESAAGESTVSKILALVENAAEKKSRAENFITKFSRIYTPCVVGSALLLAVLPPLFLGDWAKWIKNALVFLVVSCPCALVVSVPLSFFGGIGKASREGILVKGANYLEVLSKIDTVVFDKTGTLTKGDFSVTSVCPAGIGEKELLELAAHAESYSPHPIAKAIIAASGAIDKDRVRDITELPGRGVSAVVDGDTVYAGNAALMESVGAKYEVCDRVGTAVYVAKENEYLGHIIISDEIKESAKDAISALKAAGVLRTVMLTGDNADVARSVGEALGIDEVHAGLLPDGKVAALEKLIDADSPLAFVGDGVNDAPVLSRADLGVAMGALGSDAAIEAADVVLMDDDPKKIARAMKIAAKTMRIVKENIIFALAVKGAILVLGALGLANMWIAVFADVGVMVLAVMNAMRILITEKKK